MPSIERWTMIRRRDWAHDHGSLIAPGAPVPEPHDDLEVFEVVRATEVETLRAQLDAAAATILRYDDEVERLREADASIVLRLTPGEFWTLYFDAGGPLIGPWPPPDGMVSHAARERYKVKLGYAAAATATPDNGD